MASVSTVPAAKAGILALIKARPNLTAVQTGWSHPGQDISKESIFMGAARFSGEQTVALRAAPQYQDEDYTVPVWVDVLLEGDDAQAAETRMWQLVGEVEQAIRNDKTLGIGPAGGILWAQVSGKTPDEYISDQGRGCRCWIAVTVKGRS